MDGPSGGVDTLLDFNATAGSGGFSIVGSIGLVFTTDKGGITASHRQS